MNDPKLNSEEENKAAILRLYHEYFNQGKHEVADQLISPGFIAPGPDGDSSPAGFKANAARLLTAFPDIHFIVHDLIAENDRVAVYWTWEGTHRGTFNNIPPTERRVHQEGMVMYRLENGKVTAARPIFDRMGVLQQLGVLPGKTGFLTAAKPGTA